MTHDKGILIEYQGFHVMRTVRITLNFKLMFLYKKMATFRKK